MARYLITNIKWHVSNRSLEKIGELPTELEVEVGDNEVEDVTDKSEVGDLLENKISDLVSNKKLRLMSQKFVWQRAEEPDEVTTHFAE